MTASPEGTTNTRGQPARPLGFDEWFATYSRPNPLAPGSAPGLTAEAIEARRIREDEERRGVVRLAPEYWARQAPDEYKPWGKRLPIDQFNAGVIISFPDFTRHDYDPPRLPLQNGDILTYLGQWVYSKIRKFIVVELFAEHCVTVPIFTHGGYGLRGKEHKDEYIAVKDMQEMDNVSPFESEKHGYICAEKSSEEFKLSPNFHNMSPVAYAQFTAPTSFRYTWPCVFEGAVELENDIKYLRECYYGSCNRKHHPDHEQYNTDCGFTT